MPLNEEGFIARVSIRHSVSVDAVRTIMQALRAGGGTKAQFSHPEFGGMFQWSPGMSMVGDMFNISLKSKLDAVCTELAAYVAHTPSTDQDRSPKEARLAIIRRGGVRRRSDWWPTNLGTARLRLAQSAHRMISSMQFSPALEDWQSKPANISKSTIRQIIVSSAWPKRKA
jgi:hypothetical protein